MSWKRVKIKKISFVGSKPVYDLVEPRYKLFVTNGMLTEDTINFGIAYGRGAHAIATHFDKPLEECRKVVSDWWDVFQGVRTWVDSQHAFAMNHGYVITPYGRRRILREVYSDDPKIINQGMNSSVNSPVQGTAADLLMEAQQIFLEKIISPKKLRTVMVSNGHDSCMLDTPPEESEFVRKTFLETMESIRHPWMGDVPVVADCKEGPTWGDTEAQEMMMEEVSQLEMEE